MSELSELSDFSANEDKPYKCKFRGCHAAYSKNCRLMVHERKHTGVKPYKCQFPDCTKAYTNSCHLKRHICLKHEQTQEYVCDVEGCGKKFNYKYNLKRHVVRNHNRTMNFVCEVCKRGFQKKKQIQQHMYLHTGIKPFKCESCDLDFSTIIDFHKHKRNHKTYTCDCGTEFQKWTLYCAHKREVCKQVYKCTICDKVFSQSCNLKTHSITHIEESNRQIFKCTYEDCSKEYTLKPSLTQHIRDFHKKQNKNLKLECSYPDCKSVLSSELYLKRHIKYVHLKERDKNKIKKTRKDKGTKKKSMASILSGIEITAKDNNNLINNSTLTDYSRKKPEEFKWDENQTFIEAKFVGVAEHPDIEEVDSDDLLNECNFVLRQLKDKLDS